MRRRRHRGAPLAQRTARVIGLFSLGLAAPQLLAPGRVNRLVGLPDTAANRSVQRLVGARELTAAVGILPQRRPAGFLWARVLGDAMDLALLNKAIGRKKTDDDRVRAGMAAVGAIAVVDLVTALRLSRRRHIGGPVHATAAVTVNKPPEEVYARWRDFSQLPAFMAHLQSVTGNGDGRTHWVAKAPGGGTVEWDAEIVEERPGSYLAWRSVPGARVQNSGWVRFDRAPGNRGTEVHVELEYDPPAGKLGAMVAKLFGEEPTQQMKDDLRRFKQIVETGEVLRSDGSPGGALWHNQLHQRPARPHRDGSKR